MAMTSRLSDRMRWTFIFHPGDWFLLLTMILGAWPITANGYFGLTAKHSMFSLVLSSDAHVTSSARLCSILSSDGRQRRHCDSEPGIVDALLSSTKAAAEICRELTEDLRWNCELQQPYRNNLVRKAFKETAFLHALTSASLLHHVARACSEGHVMHCACAKTANDVMSSKWRWSGCGDNMDYAGRFVRRLLRIKTWAKDLKGGVDLHNSKAGIREVQRSVTRTCKCHGVSGSCTVKSCWRQMAPFSEAASNIKSRYNNAGQVVMATNTAHKEPELMTRVAGVVSKPKRRDLVYIEKSPNYCTPGPYSSGTRGRQCERNRNCDTLCCGRGYNTQVMHVERPCNCKVIWCCDVKCQTCTEVKEVFTCK